ncbi:mediator complex subunit 23-domain-containing protein [Gigaspora margarita]|nr:mediator complex subunit 23-domain-containing protein [Gigaspora margarita]
MSRNTDLATEFKTSLLNALQSREKSEQDLFQSQSSEVTFAGIFDSPSKRSKNDKIIEKKDDFELVLDTSDDITKLVQEFFKASLAVGNTGELVNYIISLLTIDPQSWERITLILSIFNGLITDTPTTFGLLLALGGDISQQSSTLQPVMHITIPQIFKDIAALLDISCTELWMGVLSFMRTILQQNPRAMVDIPPDLATDIITIILRQIDGLPPFLDKQKYKCVEKGRQMIETFLIGKDCGGTGCVSHFQVIEQLQTIYGMPVLGRFISVHWSMEQFVNELCQRRKRLAFLMIPPDASWPLISQHSRSHEYIDITHLPIYQAFSCDYEQFIDEGHATKFSSRFRDLLFQRTSIEEFKAMIKSIKSSTQGIEHMRTAFFDKVHNVIMSIQSQSNFEEPRIDQHSNEDILFPENLGFWELIIELGDQLFGLVATDRLKYEDVLSKFYYMVHPKRGEHHKAVPKDNTLIWLLIQLFYMDKVGTVISEDLKSDERLFKMLIQLYNEQQIRSRDSFFLRDLALQCAVTAQQVNIREATNIKHRYPQLGAALHYMPLFHYLKKDFEKYKANVQKHDLFRNLSIQEMIKISIASQISKNVVADTLFSCLVPARLEFESGKLGFPDAKFLKGGIIEYKLLDLINVTSKYRLIELIYKMSLDGDNAPKYPKDVAEHKITCVSPYVLDVLYKTVYSAPWSLEPLVKEILEKLKHFDKVSKISVEGGTSQLTEIALRWKHTILQILCHRFHRFLKHSAKAPDLLHYIKYSVSHLGYRQTYRDAELFALHIMMMQTDVKFIKSLSDPNRDKQIWFPESELLARYMIYTMARLIKLRGVGDVPDIINVILEIYPHPIQWSDTTLSFFPEPLRSQLAAQQMTIGMTVSSISFTDKDMNSALQVGNLFKLFMDQALNTEDETTLQEHYSKLENQPIFLCSLWKIGCGRKILNPDMMSTLRKVLLQFPPSRMATYTMTLIDFIIEMIERDPNGSPVDVCCKMLDELIWKYQILALEHVLFALVKGHSEVNATAIGILDYLLFKSEEFSGRVEYFISLKFSHRYWTEDNHHDKLTNYLERYPEYFQYEAFAMDGYETVNKSLDPPLVTNMPIYYTTVIRRSLPILDIVIGRLIEFGQQEMLAKLLDKYGPLYRYHQTPLAFVRDLLHYYYSAPALRDQSISTRLIKLLDFDEYDIDSQLLQYGSGNDGFLVELFDITYFEKVFQKLADSMSPDTCAPKTDAKFPERHFREIPNPVVLALHIACIEVLATTIPSDQIVKDTLDIITSMNGRKNMSVQPMVMHAMGLLYSFLPTEDFLYQMFDKVVLIITTDPHLKEFSQPFNLIKREQSQSSLSYLDHASYQSDPLQPWPFLPSTRAFSAMFPYIFNEYASNLHNFGTNVANSLLTFIHSLLHYSNIDDIQILLTKLLTVGDGINTDVQILYLCALIGPVIHRLLENHILVLTSYILHIIQLLNSVTLNIELVNCGDTTLALEQIYDFL